uniref:Growth arrest and DNA damage inducible beta n=1 Tax=Callithrix jacchus TaxID=9483 RepID=A0A8I3XCR0_CALJA
MITAATPLSPSPPPSPPESIKVGAGGSRLRSPKRRTPVSFCSFLDYSRRGLCNIFFFFSAFSGRISLLPEGLGRALRLREKVCGSLARILQFLPGDRPGAASTVDYNCNMTLEELVACDNAAQKMQTVTAAVEELLVAAQRQDRLTVGVYESAKLMNVDPDSVVLCLLAIDEEEEGDIALQIHFTLIQSFCCDNDINIVRVSGMQRLAQLLGEPAETQGTTEARDLHCLLVTNPHTDSWKSRGLVEVASYCEESRAQSPQNNPTHETIGGRVVGD